MPQRVWAQLFVLSGISCALTFGSASAQDEYVYAQGLLEFARQGFNTEDLVERLARKTSCAEATLIESKMIRALLTRHQARRASTEKRLTMLQEALGVYQETSAMADSALKAIALNEVAGLRKMILGIGREFARTKPELMAELNKEWSQTFDAENAADLAAADKALRDFSPWYEKLKAILAKNPEAVLPPDLKRNLDAIFDIWMKADRQYVGSLFEQLKLCSADDPAAKSLATAITTFCDARAEHEAMADFPLAHAWYPFMSCRTHLHMENETSADEALMRFKDGLAELTDIDAAQSMIMHGLLFHGTVEMKFKQKEYAWVVEKVATVMHEDLWASLHSKPEGKHIFMLYAQSLVLQETATTEDFERAVAGLNARIESQMRNGMATIWSNEFHLCTAKVFQVARNKSLFARHSARSWMNAATGFTLLAAEPYLRYTEECQAGLKD
jgi:hypothetical protein